MSNDFYWFLTSVVMNCSLLVLGYAVHRLAKNVEAIERKLFDLDHAEVYRPTKEGVEEGLRNGTLIKRTDTYERQLMT